MRKGSSEVHGVSFNYNQVKLFASKSRNAQALSKRLVISRISHPGRNTVEKVSSTASWVKPTDRVKLGKRRKSAPSSPRPSPTRRSFNQHPLEAEILDAMEAKIEFSPAIPLPVPFDVQKRIQELRSYLDPNDPNYQPEQQHINIRAAIKLYEDGKIDGMEQVCIMDGKVVSKKEMFAGSSWAMCEGRFHQFAQKHAHGHGPFGV